MNVSDFLRGLKKLKKDSCARRDDQDTGDAVRLLDQPPETVAQRIHSPPNDVDEVEGSDEEGGSSEVSADSGPSSFLPPGIKRQRYDVMWRGRENHSGMPRPGYTELRTYQTNHSVAQNSNEIPALRHRTMASFSPRTNDPPKRDNVSVLNALREELVRKKNALSHNALVEMCTKRQDEKVPLSGATEIGMEELLLRVDDLISSGDVVIKHQPHIKVNDAIDGPHKEIANAGLAASISAGEPEPHLDVVVHSIHEKSKMSMFARAKLCSSVVEPQKEDRNVEKLKTKKFHKSNT